MKLASLVLAFAVTPLAAQETGGFVTRLGNDTVAVERFTHTARRLEGEIVSRVPNVTVRTYSIDFGADGRATRAEVTVRRPGQQAPIQVSVATFTADSVMVETRRDTAVQRRRIKLEGTAIAVPAGPNQSWAITEVLAQRLRASRTDSVTWPAYFVGANGTFLISWVRASADSVRIYSGDGMWVGRLGRNGKLESVSPRAGTQQFTTDRLATPLDLARVTTAWNSGQAAQPAGILSPRDTVNASIAGATLWLDYGRPSKRGRTVYGSPIAPWGQVWRTGANAATQFRTDRDLEIGGVTLRAGSYTLWTIPSSDGAWKLLINTQTGQWGTAHDPRLDIYQLDLRTTRLPSVVERFTISFVPDGQGGLMHLDWDTTRVSIPFTVR